jgi:hypothetical protein
MLACGQPVSGKDHAKQTINAPNNAKPPNHPFPRRAAASFNNLLGEKTFPLS